MQRATVSGTAVLAAMAVFLSVAGCQQTPAPQPPTITPTATLHPTVTAAPTATRVPATPTPAPSPTAVPTATAAPKTPTPVAAAGKTPSAISPGGTQSFEEMDKLFAETMPTMMAEVLPTMMAVAMPTAMAEIMPTVMAILPTAPPAPKGDAVTLSQADLGGRWQGWITVEAVALDGASAAEQKSCDDQLKVIKGRQLPTAMDFLPQSATAGTVKIITEESTQGMAQDESMPYSYRSGSLTITADGPDGNGSFEGKTIQTSTGYAISGTWTSESVMDPSLSGMSGMAVISGNWVVQKPRR